MLQALFGLLTSVDPRRRGGSLPRLERVHEHAGRQGRRWRGIYPVPVARIVGTASAQPRTRRRNFLPAIGHEPADWSSRWATAEAAAAELRPLPPIDVMKVGDGYWVLDGHNRVALAKRVGQIVIDANVVEV